MIRAALTGLLIGLVVAAAPFARGMRDLTPYERTWISPRRRHAR